MAVLLGWNFAATALWLSGRSAQAEAPSCAVVESELAAARQALAQRDSDLRALAGRVRRLALDDIRTVARALTGTGVSTDELGETRMGAGGPYAPFSGAAGLAEREADRWEAVRHAVGTLPLVSPLSGARMSSGFGPRIDPINGRRAMHEGVDLVAPLGTPIHVPAPGRVVFAGYRPGYGRMVEVDHGNGIHSRYAHLSVVRVHAGERVARGQRIGEVGDSGRSTGPHLHYEILVERHAHDPVAFLRAGARLEGGLSRTSAPSRGRPRYGSHGFPRSRGRHSRRR